MRDLCQRLDIKDLKDEILQSLQGFKELNQSQRELLAKSEYFTEKISLLPNVIGNEIRKVVKEESRPLQLEIVDNDRNFLKKINENFHIFQKIWIGFFIFGCLSILALWAIFSFGKTFYNESIRSKQELRDEILLGFKKENKVFVNKDELKAYENERAILKGFIRERIKGSEEFLIYRSGVINNVPNAVVFKDMESEEVRKK